MPVNLSIPTLGNKFQDYRDPIPGDSYNWGVVIDATKVDAFAFHHSVTVQTAKNDGNWKAECDKIANLHINNNGWGGVGYRFIIASDGTVAYVGDLSHGGSAILNNNDHVFSACLVGDFTKELPTAAQVHSAHLLAKHFLDNMPQYPLLDSWDDIKGHKDFMATACPGSNWRTAGDSLRDRIINDRFDGYPNPQPIIAVPPTVDPILALKKELEEAKNKISTLEKQALDKSNALKSLVQQANSKLSELVEIVKKIEQL